MASKTPVLRPVAVWACESNKLESRMEEKVRHFKGLQFPELSSNPFILVSFGYFLPFMSVTFFVLLFVLFSRKYVRTAFLTDPFNDERIMK